MRTNGQISRLRSGVSAERRPLVQMAALCRDAATRSRRALTLIEMMVSMTLLAVIMIGLLAMFTHAQKSLHIAATQTDVFENARGAIQLLSRDLSEMTAYEDTNVQSAFLLSQPSPGGTLPLPSGGSQDMDMNQAFWLTRANDGWQGIGYYVAEDSVGRANLGVGTLYRFSQSANHARVPALQGYFNDLALTNQRVSDGVVHFSMRAAYVTNTGSVLNPVINFAVSDTITFPQIITEVLSNQNNIIVTELPAYVDVELGILEPSTLKQFQSIADVSLASAQIFLINHVGKIHFFRERVPIRNFINPYRANEVP